MVGGKLELDVIPMLSAKVDAMSYTLERVNINSMSSSTPSLSCEIYGSVDHLIVNCQVGSPFAQDGGDSVNYVNNFNPRLTNYPICNTYKPGWTNHTIPAIGLTPLRCLK